MNDRLKDILSTSANSIDPVKLMAYLNNELSPEEAQKVEEKLAADEFQQTALEGLEVFRNKKELEAITYQLNRELNKKIRKRNQQRKKSRGAQPMQILVVTIIFLLLIILAYWIISRLLSL